MILNFIVAISYISIVRALWVLMNLNTIVEYRIPNNNYTKMYMSINYWNMEKLLTDMRKH